MVRGFIYILAVWLWSTQAQALYVANPVLVEGDACDDRQAGDDVKTSENRAVDKACLAAIKTSGIIQKVDDELDVATLDLVAYRIIDEHLYNIQHETKHEDKNRVCVRVNATLQVAPETVKSLMAQHKKSTASDDVVEVALSVQEKMSVKPQTLQEKKLLYIENMQFWNGSATDHYAELLTELFSHSDYFYVTTDKKMADYVVSANLKKSEVDKLDGNNLKMQMLLELKVTAPLLSDFKPISEIQNHFILFGSDKDEQQIADTLIKKLLTRAAKSVSDKVDKYQQTHLENQKIRKKS